MSPVYAYKNWIIYSDFLADLGRLGQNALTLCKFLQRRQYGLRPWRYSPAAQINVQIQPLGRCSQVVFVRVIHALKLVDALVIVSQNL